MIAMKNCDFILRFFPPFVSFLLYCENNLNTIRPEILSQKITESDVFIDSITIYLYIFM